MSITLIRVVLSGLLASILGLASATPTGAVVEPSEGDVCPAVTDTITRLYAAYFEREPDLGGFDFWVRRASGSDTDLPDISDFFVQSLEFQQRYGPLDDEAFIRTFYRRVFGREVDEGGLQFWLTGLETEYTRGDVMVFWSESPEFVELTRTERSIIGIFQPGRRVWCSPEPPAGNFNASIAPGFGPDLNQYVELYGSGRVTLDFYDAEDRLRLNVAAGAPAFVWLDRNQASAIARLDVTAFAPWYLVTTAETPLNRSQTVPID